MDWGRWVIVRNPLLHLRFETELPFDIWFSAKSGRAVIDELHLQPLVHLHQVHSADVHRFDGPKSEQIEGDGLISNTPGLYLAVKVADCYPIFIMDPVNLAFGVVHAGWRGSAKGIVQNAIRKMTFEFGSDPKNLFVAIGPGICGKCYEVSKDVASKFDAGVFQLNGKIFLDLATYNIKKMKKMGVPESQILRSPFCTYEQDDLFWSYRRDGQRKRSMWAVIGLKTKGR